MGQATAIDLPESAQSSPPASSSADELLSQLAGQEIDRLLADAEKADDNASATAAAEDPVDPSAPEQVEAILAPAKLAADAETAEQPAVAGKEEYAAEVGKVFNQLNVAPAAEAEATNESKAAPHVEEQTSVAERAELTPVAPEPPATVQQVLEQATTVERTPFYVRALEILNSPFSFCPDEVRDTLGKVAILTMMNSLGVLLYVMLFKKH